MSDYFETIEFRAKTIEKETEEKQYERRITATNFTA